MENIKKFSEIVLGSYPRKEVISYFRRNGLNNEKGWRVIDAQCEFAYEHENYMCPYSYHRISATFVKKG